MKDLDLVLYSQSQRGEHEKQSMLPCMKHNGHYVKFCTLRSVLLTQFGKFVGLLPALYKYRGDVEINHYNIAKSDCLAFKTNIFCVSKPTFNSVAQNHVGS